jgi:glycosyltransferase involved in cell wall biosynthesis
MTPATLDTPTQPAANPFWHAETDPAQLPTISIVTVCRNHASYLDAALQSVLDQAYPKLEYIVLDGGSDDGSTELIARHAERMAYWHSEPDRGQYFALDAGLRRSTGQIMCWLNADDLLHRNALWTVAEIFRRFPDVQWLHGLPTHYDAAGRAFASATIPRWSRLRYLRGDYCWIQQESVFWRRSLWDAAGGYLDTDLRLAADMELWMRFFRHARLYTTTALLGGFRHVPDQRSRRQHDAYIAEADTIVAREPHTPDDTARLRALARYERLWLRLPLIRQSWRIRHGFEQLFNYPPLISHNSEHGLVLTPTP